MHRRPLDHLRIAVAHAIRLTASILRKAATLLDTTGGLILGSKLQQQLQLRAVVAAMDSHDMTLNADESHYADTYWSWIESRLPKASGGNWIDAGCGSGRLTLPLARSVEGRHQFVIGVDIHAPALDIARNHAIAQGFENVEFVAGEIVEYLRGLQTNSVAGALFIEVGFFMTNLDDALSELFRVICPGGMLFVTHRPTWFMVAHNSARENWDAVETALTTTSGILPGWGSWQNWSTRDESEAILRSHGFAIEGCIGIGTLSGIEGDPLANLNTPSALNPRAVNLLSKAESIFGATSVDSARYMLFAARKPLADHGPP